MSAQLTLRSLSAATIKAMLDDGIELALIDVREELTFSQNHLLWARNVPLSRLELRFARLVPRLTTRIVLCDDNDGLAKRTATILANAGYADLSYLQGGIAAWDAAGFVLSPSGVHVPSKAFGEFVEHDSGTPSNSAGELNAMMRNGTDIKVLDSRPFDEYARISIPTGINVPGAELVLRVRDIPLIRHNNRRQLRWANPKHHRRAIANQRRRAEQSRGAAQRHHGLAPGRPRMRQRQHRSCTGGIGRWPEVGEIGGCSGRAKIQRWAYRPCKTP
jgi:rhodanese-related sulfurtransferase